MRSVISPSVVVMDDRYIMEIGGAVHDEDVSVKTLQFEEIVSRRRFGKNLVVFTILNIKNSF